MTNFSKKDDKILVVTNMYPSKKDPIYGNFVKEQYDFLKENGYQTKLSKITERDGTPTKKITKYLKLYISSFFKALDPKVKIIHYHYEYPTALTAPFFKHFLKKKIFLTVHGTSVLRHKGLKKKLISSFFKSSDYVVGVSDYLKRELEQTYQLPPEKVLSIHCGVNVEKFSPSPKEEERTALNLPQDKKIALYIGRIHEEKGIDYYSEVIPELIRQNNQLYFLFVGNGPHRHHIDKLISEFPENVEYRKGVSKEEVPKYFSASDLFVFPTKMETFGLVAIEALSTNTLVVASNVGGVPEIIKNGERGFLFEDQNKEELKEKIQQAISLNDKERIAIHLNGRKYSQENTVSHQMAKLITFYEKV